MELGENKPQKNAFVTWWSIQISIFFLPAIIISLVFASYQATLYLIGGILGLIYLLLLANRRAKFKKTKYQFFEDRIIVHSGGLFSNTENELVLKNVTHVKLIRPWIENKLYSTGRVEIHSAGSAGAEISLTSIAQSEKYYPYVEELLEKRRFTLSNKVIREEEPAKIGIIFNIIGMIVGIGFFGLFIGLPTLIGGLSAFPIPTLIIALGIISLATFIIWATYQDLSRRKYYLCKGVVRYKEGFLTRRDAFIPIQNVTDATQTQGIIDRILELYSVAISCQGSGQEVSFLYMRNGEELAKEIDNQLSQRKELPTTKKTTKTTAKAVYDTKFTAEFKPSLLRAAMPGIILLPLTLLAGMVGIFFPVSLAITIQVIIFGAIAIAGVIFNAAITSFAVGKESIRQKTQFLSKKTQEFTLDKVTGVVYKENPFDRLLKTGSTLFWSIGSSSSINFFHVKNMKEILPKLLAKAGIQKEAVKEEITVAYNPIAMIFANIFFIIVFILVTLALGVFEPALMSIPVVLLILTIGMQIWSYSKYKLTLQESHLTFTKGIFWKEYYYIRYDDIKDLESTKYPIINKGKLQVNVAGEQVIKTDKHQSIVSNGFKIPYLKNVKELHNHLDNILGAENNVVLEDEQALANSVPGMLFFLAIVNVLGSIALSFLPINIPILQFAIPVLSILIVSFWIIAIKKVRYEVQEGRAVRKSGVIYKRMKSIGFSRINTVGKSQGMFNKMFKNGNVKIHTTGSTSDIHPEITLRNAKKHLELYKELKYE